ncbi:MAG: NAD(P)-binding domain-containing protein [Oscillospiraceae bacterium]|jgi:pyrroline-5-carboxylate reductase|nr:NAD(P)-binding domain-containing protein [Oscillospiraceae bacterium]
MRLKLGIVGAGHLGSALYRGLLRSGTPPEDIILCVRPETVGDCAERFRSPVTGDINEAAAFAGVVFLVTRAAQFEQIAERGLDKSAACTFVSFMAGVTLARLGELTGSAELVRAMPSLAIESQDGIIGYTHCDARIAGIFESLGYAFEVGESDIEKVTAFSGCGPGFAAYIIDAFSRAGQSLGFSVSQADIIATNTFAAVCRRGGDYASLAEAVATPGGATEQGILRLRNYNVEDALKAAVAAAYDKVK